MQKQDTQSQNARTMRPTVLLKNDNGYCYGFKGSNKIKNFHKHKEAAIMFRNEKLDPSMLWYDFYGPEMVCGFQHIDNLEILDKNGKIKTVEEHLREVNQAGNVGLDEYLSRPLITPSVSVSTQPVSQQSVLQTSFWDSLPDITTVGNVLSQIGEKFSECASSVYNSFSSLNVLNNSNVNLSINCCNASTVDRNNELNFEATSNASTMR